MRDRETIFRHLLKLKHAPQVESLDQISTQNNEIAKLGNICFQLDIKQEQVQFLKGTILYQQRIFPGYYEWDLSNKEVEIKYFCQVLADTMINSCAEESLPF